MVTSEDELVAQLEVAHCLTARLLSLTHQNNDVKGRHLAFCIHQIICQHYSVL